MTIRNVGRAPSAATALSGYVVSAPGQSAQVLPLAINESGEACVTFTGREVGTYLSTIVVDQQGAVQELREDNNRLTFNVQVVAQR